MSEFFKKNKLILIVVTLLLVLIIKVSFFGHKASSRMNQSSSQPSVVDRASGDDTAESLNALTQEFHQVISSNKQLQASNAKLSKKNASILRNIKEEVQQNFESELHKRGQDNNAKIADLRQQLQQINAALKKVNHRQSDGVGGAYSVDGQSQPLASGKVINLNGQNLIALPDMAGVHSIANSASRNTLSHHNSEAILHPNGSDQMERKAKSIPYYTIPSGATLAGSVSMSALIGRVPVNGVVKSPYPFKMIIGGDNMAANGLHIPGVSGAIIQGYTVGDMALSCVKGYITAMTFVFPDGTVYATSISQTSSNGDLGVNNSLGYISEPNGNPCFPGTFYTNAPQYLATMIALGALNQGGHAYRTAQQTSMSNAFGGTTTELTGSVSKYMLGGAVQGSTQQIMNWFTEREKNSFDAVYVSAGKKAVINITKQIAINYNPNGRKIYYEHIKNTQHNTSLD